MASAQKKVVPCDVEAKEFEEYEQEMEVDEYEEYEEYEEFFEEEEEAKEEVKEVVKAKSEGEDEAKEEVKDVEEAVEAEEDIEEDLEEVTDKEENDEQEEEDEEEEEEDEEEEEVKEDLKDKKKEVMEDLKDKEEEEEMKEDLKDREEEKEVKEEVKDNEEEKEEMEEEEEEIEKEEIEQEKEKEDKNKSFNEEDKKIVVEVCKVQGDEASAQDPLKEEQNSASPPPFIQPVSDFEKLNRALSEFLNQWSSLNRSLHSIAASIDAHAPSQIASSIDAHPPSQIHSSIHAHSPSQISSSIDAHAPFQIASSTDAHAPSQIASSIDAHAPSQIASSIDAHATYQHAACSSKQHKDENSEKKEAGVKDERREQKKSERSLAEIFGNDVDPKALRKYIENHFSNLARLRVEVPEVIRRISNPEKFVFEAIGKFYMQESKDYIKSPGLVSLRRAAILLMEFFVLSGCSTSDFWVKREAMHGACLWLKRLAKEGIETASAVESLGLILYLACFGVPSEFGIKDFSLLLWKSNVRKKIDVFLKSNILVEKIPAVIKEFIIEEKYVEAAELSCCFGLEDPFPPMALLTSYAEKTTQIGKQERSSSSDSITALLAASTKELMSMKVVAKILEDHKLGVLKVGGIAVGKRIRKLEKTISYCNERLEKENGLLKRKPQHLGSSERPETRPKLSPSSSSSPLLLFQPLYRLQALGNL